MTIEKTVDQMQIAGAATAGKTARSPVKCASAPAAKAAVSSCLSVNPVDIATPAQRFRDSVETVADDAIDPFNACGSQNFCEVVGYGLCHRIGSFIGRAVSVAADCRSVRRELPAFSRSGLSSLAYSLYGNIDTGPAWATNAT
jgi:hypothetical protein